MPEQRLFLAANFEDFSVGLAENESWKIKVQQKGYIVDQLYIMLEPIIEQCNYENLTIYLLNGPGSILGIRTLCAFINTLLALNYIQPPQVYVCDNLHFAQYYRRLQNQPPTLICARVNLTQTLCLGTHTNDILHPASEVEKQQALWLPHPCLPKTLPQFYFNLDFVLPTLVSKSPWHHSKILDVFDSKQVR